jgi:DNA primase
MHAEQSLQGRAVQNAVDKSSILDTLFMDDQPAGFAGFELHIHEKHLDDLQYGLIEEIIDWFEDDDLPEVAAAAAAAAAAGSGSPSVSVGAVEVADAVIHTHGSADCQVLLQQPAAALLLHEHQHQHVQQHPPPLQAQHQQHLQEAEQLLYQAEEQQQQFQEQQSLYMQTLPEHEPWQQQQQQEQRRAWMPFEASPFSAVSSQTPSLLQHYQCLHHQQPQPQQQQQQQPQQQQQQHQQHGCFHAHSPHTLAKAVSARVSLCNCLAAHSACRWQARLLVTTATTVTTP